MLARRGIKLHPWSILPPTAAAAFFLLSFAGTNSADTFGDVEDERLDSGEVEEQLRLVQLSL
jgi:hypothetical protein